MALATSTIIALAMAAAAAGASYYNTRQTQNKADAVALQGLQAQKKNSAEAKKRTDKLLSDESGSSLDANAKTAQGQYLAQVQRQMAQANAGLTQRGLNADFDQRAGGAAAQNADWGATAAKLLGTIDGAQLQRNNESQVAGNASMDYDVLGKKAAGDEWVNQMKMRAVRRNPYLDLAAGLMNGAAGAVGSYAGSQGSSATTVNPYADLSAGAYGTSNNYAGGVYS